MTELEFDMLIKRAIAEHIDEYFPETAINRTPHKFSRDFERKMNKLMGKPVISRHISPKKVITYVTVAIIAACIISISISAVREAFINFITNVFSTHTEVYSVSDDSDHLDFADIYEITSDMSDFELTDVSEDIFEREYTYQNEHCKIIYEQYIKKYYKAYENTEGYHMEKIFVNDFEGYYIDMSKINTKTIVWDNGDYVFAILAKYDDVYTIDKNSVIDIAKSVQKVE